MTEEHIINPFLNFLKVDNYSDLYSEYNSLYILCSNNIDNVIDGNIYEYYIDMYDQVLTLIYFVYLLF